MSSIDYLLDRLAIQDTLVRFSTAIDTGQHALLDQVFTPDATLDYGEYFGPGNLENFRRWAEATMDHIAACQHLLSNFVIEIEGDTATARTPDGWRIGDRKMIALSGLDPDTLG